MLKRKQSGAALVVAMLIVSLVTAIAATATIRHHFMLRRLSNQLQASQAYSYMRVAELIAIKALTADLEADAKEKNRFDHFGEIWAQKLPPFLIDGGSYGGELIDLQGKFNLNNLATSQQVKGGKQVPFTAEQGIFIRLLQSYNDDKLNITYDRAVVIAQAVLDWVDPNTATNFSYCEDNAYASMEGRTPHRAANMPFMSVSELLLICDMPVELYRRMKDDLTVWPREGGSTININTANEHLLRSVIMPSTDAAQLKSVKKGNHFQPPPPLEKDQLKQFMEQQLAGFTTWSQATSALSYYNFWPGSELLSLHSDFFLLKAQAELGGLHQRYFSILDRRKDKIVVLFRSVDDL